MLLRQIGVILKGIIAGAYIGYVLGKYICVLTSSYVIQSIDYSHSFYYAKTQERFSEMIVLSFVIVFTIVGPFVAAASLGRWMRHAFYGLLGCMTLVVEGALMRAAYLNENPFFNDSYHNTHMIESTSIDAARLYGIPASFVIGPLAGILIGLYRKKPLRVETNP